MLPNAYVVHSVPGRLRIRIPSKRGDPGYFASIRRAFSDHPHITTLEINAETGGVLLRFNPPTEPLQLDGRTNGLFALQDDPVPELLDTISLRAARLNGTIRRSTGGLDVPSMLFFALAGMGLYQLWQGRVLAPATTLLWYAGEIARRRSGDADVMSRQNMNEHG